MAGTTDSMQLLYDHRKGSGTLDSNKKFNKFLLGPRTTYPSKITPKSVHNFQSYLESNGRTLKQPQSSATRVRVAFISALHFTKEF